MIERTVGEHKLTDEMNLVIDAVINGDNIKGEAFAGAGKSSTLRAIEKYHTNKQGLYICFNKTLENDARSLFKGNNIHISTAHAIALNSNSKAQINKILDCIKNKSWSYKRLISASNLSESDNYVKQINLKNRWKLLIEIVELYLTTASKTIKECHLTEQYHAHISKQIKNGNIFDTEVESINKTTIKVANDIALAMLDMDSEYPKTHDAYVKAWQLSEPQLNYDYIMFDEAQDASPVLLSVILKQSCQQIFVGDRYQSIYQFKGSVNAMDIIPYKTYPLSQSFRYGKEIADLASTILQHHNESVNISGINNDSKIVNAKDYEGTDKLLYITHTNKGLYEALITSFQTGAPTKCIGNKVEFTLNNLKSLFSLHNNGKGELSAHSRYTSLEEIIDNDSINSETKYLAELILKDPKKASILMRAIEWSIYMSDEDSHVHLVTAHGSKGLEADTVMLADDFYEAMNSFGKGKPMSEQELYLLYVAVTRAKKTLVLADELYTALTSNLAFTLKKPVVPDYLLDDLQIPDPTVSNEQQKADSVPPKPTPNVQNEQPGSNADSVSEEPNSKVQGEQSVPEEQAVETHSEQQEQTVQTEQSQPPAYEPPADEPEPEPEPEPESQIPPSSLDSSHQKPENEVEGEGEDAPKTPPTANGKPKNKKTTDDKEKVKEEPREPHSEAMAINIGECKDTGEQVNWLPTDTSQFLNPNIAILGTMGTGKTQTAKSMLLQLHRQRKANTRGEKFGILIFDYKDDYTEESFVEATNAIVLEGCDLPINPFALFTKKDKLAPIKTAAAFATTLANVFKLGPKQIRNLKTCIDLAYQTKGIIKGKVETFDNEPPTLDDVFKVFNEQESIASDSLLSALCDLNDNEVFEKDGSKCKTLYEMLNDNIVVVKLSGVDSSLQVLVVALLLDSFFMQMHVGGKPKPEGHYRAIRQLIMVDEADNFLSRDFPSLKKVLKEGREYGVGMILSTQALDHFKTSENDYLQYQEAIICHRLNGSKKMQIQSLLSVEEKAEVDQYHAMIGKLDKHHALFIDSKKKVTHQESTAFWKMIE